MTLATQPTSLAEPAIEALRRTFRGRLVQPSDPGYDEARQIWNGLTDKHPGLVAYATSVEDVQAAVRVAREYDVLLAPRCGGHHVAGLGTCEGGLLLDLSGLRGVRVDPASRRVWAQGGCLLGDVDHATQRHGLAVPVGAHTTNGFSGSALGGGWGWLARTYGLTCDNMLAATVVTAEGEVVRASEDENPDLFWGLRGGGGNFGIVVEFEVQAYPVTEILVGRFRAPTSEGVRALRLYREVAASAPDQLFLHGGFGVGPDMPEVPEAQRTEPSVMLFAGYIGDPEEGRRAMRQLAELSPGGPEPQVLPFLPLQTHPDPFPFGLMNYLKTGYFQAMSDGAIEVLVDFASRPPGPLMQLEFPCLGGAIARVPEDATAYSNRQAPFMLNSVTAWRGPSKEEAEGYLAWNQGLYDALRPYLTGGAYVNFLTEDDHPSVVAAYGEAKYQRLQALKDRWEPTNLFRRNMNIRPTGWQPPA